MDQTPTLEETATRIALEVVKYELARAAENNETIANPDAFGEACARDALSIAGGLANVIGAAAPADPMVALVGDAQKFMRYAESETTPTTLEDTRRGMFARVALFLRKGSNPAAYFKPYDGVFPVACVEINGGKASLRMSPADRETPAGRVSIHWFELLCGIDRIAETGIQDPA